jgi:HAD superfamily hydrolase (TIGR01509 family)
LSEPQPGARSMQDASGRRAALAAVVFVAGGTLLRLDFEWMAASLTRDGFATDARALRRGEVEGRRRYDQSRGTDSDGGPLGGPGDVRAYFGGMLEAVGLPSHLVQPTVTRFLSHEKSSGLWTRPMEGARQALEGVAALGLRRAVVSNSDGRAEWHLENTGLLDAVEFVVDSHLVGVEKPDPAIFAIALSRLEVAPERALYVGDIRSVDEAGARSARMQFVLIDPWSDYAPQGVAAIRAIEDLPEWIAKSFAVPRLAGSSDR